MQHLEVSCVVRPIEWPLGVKLLNYQINDDLIGWSCSKHGDRRTSWKTIKKKFDS